MASSTARASFYAASNNGGGRGSGWVDSRGPPANENDRQLPHIKDIITTAQPTFDPVVQLNDYLNQAEYSLQSAQTSINFGRADIAFREYLKASEIAINIIPRHKDYGFWDNNKSWAERYRKTRHTVSAMSNQMQGVRKMIEDNNARHGTTQHSTTTGTNAIANSGAYHTQSRPLSQGGAGVSANGLPDVPASLRVEKPRPPSVIKPEQLRGEPIAPNDLSQRFARLRTHAAEKESATSISMPKVEDFKYGVRADQSQHSTNETSNPSQSNGYRNSQLTSMPSLPPKVPLPPSVSMPKAPDATYSPGYVQPGHQVGRQSHEGNRPPTKREHTYYGQPIGATTSLQLQRAKEDVQPYRPRTPNGINHAIVPKSSSSEIPHKETISAERLSEYIRRYNILLIDIRERTAFDEGHIFANSILCIEPLSLREGTSAEALEDRLVISPDVEQAFFSRRNEFDVVVYYDQSTSDISYLQGPPTMNKTPYLRAFYDTLYEFNEYKPLKDGRPPALLRGGLDAWIDLMGPQSLATSNTAVMLGSTRQRPPIAPGRPLGRQRMASANSRFEIRDRRLRNQKFLDENEQQAWRQQAQQEQVATAQSEHITDGDLVEMEDEQEALSPFVPDYETFLRRFPAVDQQSMMMPARKPVASVPPRYEPPPVPSIPSRPPPAVPRPSYSGHADIIQPQAPLARVVSGTRQPLYSPSMSVRNRRIPRTGLLNFGVTCYMNSVLQCLSATIPLANFFMDEGAYKRNVQQNWKGSSGIMPEIFANVVRSLWKGDVDMIKPVTFRNFCGRMNREWVIDRQQDAKEFFDFLVDCLHEDLNIAWQRNPLTPLTTEQEMQREKYKITEACGIEWQRYEHRDRSFISSLFAGQHASRLKCLTCRNTSTTYEAFYSISIEIPRSGQGDIYRCLESYTQEERLDPGEFWRCPYCNCEREATKQIILTRLPQFLVIHFKRFSASKTESARKVHTPIEFPLHGLKMDRYVLSVPSQKSFVVDSGFGTDGQPATAMDGQVDLATTPPFDYDAYGVLRHLGGSGDGGHYVSIVRDPGRGCWRKFDDERHCDLDPAQLKPADKLQNREAYIVFYQRSTAR